jgi:hypothetical protein
MRCAPPAAASEAAKAVDELDPLTSDWRSLDDDLTVLCWRTERLIALGYELREAAYLAISDVDVHELERLIGKGCPTETAVRIAA